MASNADVQSLERLELFLGQLESLRFGLLKEIENLELELRRLTNWLENEACGYWLAEMRAADRKFVDAQDNLSRCMSYVRSSERRPCTEEKKRVLKAKLRRETCELKLKTVRQALQHWERERLKNQARIERCRDMADSDLLLAANHLRSQVERLAAYTSLRSSAVSNGLQDRTQPDTLEQTPSSPEPTTDAGSRGQP